MSTVNGEKKFHIASNFTLSPDDNSVLSLLYAPLIGSDAYLLYMAFCELLERNNLKSEEYTHDAFFKMFNFKTKSFTTAKEKLEGIGLLLTYLDENEDYLYIVNPPLTARNFLKDATLGLYLYSKLGEDVFNQIYKHFKIEKFDKNKYTNITKSFDDVYESVLVNDKTYDKFSYILGRKLNQNIKIEHAKFDLEYFIKNIDVALLETGVTSKFKDQIINLSFVYGFNEDEMIGLFNDSINKTGFYDYRLLKKKANNLFKFKRNMNAPILKEKDKNELDASSLNNWLENAPAKDILASQNENFSPAYLDTINDIYANIELPRGVLNVMILKVLTEKGGELPNLKYFKKMSETWISDNIFTTEDAIKYSVTAKLDDIKPNKKKNDDDIGDNGGFTEL